MSLTKRISSMFPSKKWCGCDVDFEDSSSYQFRVKARSEDDTANLFQIREKRRCEKCGDEEVDVHVQDECVYTPQTDIHERRVGVGEDEMIDRGFMDTDEMLRMLIEMRLSNSFDPETAD